MKTGYDKFFKAARDNKSPTDLKKVNVKKLQKKNTSANQSLKSAIESVKNELKQKRRARMQKQFPVGAGIFLGLFLIGALFLGYNVEKAEEILSAIEVKILGTASAADPSPAKSSDTKGKKEEKVADAAAKTDQVEKATSHGYTPEELALFKSLEARKTALDQRESELKKLEEDLQAQKVEIDKRLAQIEEVRKAIANQLEEKVNVDKERVEQLVSFYSSMKPQQAAKIIESLNEDLAVEVLLKMKKKNAAEVMNLIDAAKAQRLSERFAGYRRK